MHTLAYKLPQFQDVDVQRFYDGMLACWDRDHAPTCQWHQESDAWETYARERIAFAEYLAWEMQGPPGEPIEADRDELIGSDGWQFASAPAIETELV